MALRSACFETYSASVAALLSITTPNRGNRSRSLRPNWPPRTGFWRAATKETLPDVALVRTQVELLMSPPRSRAHQTEVSEQRSEFVLNAGTLIVTV